MNVKTSELTGTALDWAVAKCEGMTALEPKPTTVDDVRALNTPFQMWEISHTWVGKGENVVFSGCKITPITVSEVTDTGSIHLKDAEGRKALGSLRDYFLTMEDAKREAALIESGGPYWHGYSPSTKWEEGGPIIEREGISLDYRPPGGSSDWYAEIADERIAWSRGDTAVRQAEVALSAAVCGECHRPYSAEELKLAEARFEATCQLRDAAAAELDANAGPVKQATDHLAQLRKDFHPGCVAELERVRQALEREAASKLINLVEFETLTLLEAEAEAIHLTLPTLRAELADMTQQQGQRNRTQILLDTAVAAMQDMAHDRQEAERQLALVPPIEDPQGLTSQLQAAQHQSQQLRATLQQAGQEMAVAAREAESLQKTIEDGQSIKSQRAELERGLAGRKKLQSWLRKSRADLMLELWEGLFHYASHLLTSTTGGQIRRVYRRDGDIVVDEGGEPVPVSELSGFQRSLVGLALRVGLSRVFYGGDLPLMLDEPTADASEDNAARVAGMLQALKSQVIIVSHRLGDAANAQTLIQL